MTSLRVLLIEDDPVIGALLTIMLEDMGHSVCGIETTEASAVAAALRVMPDLMIVDGRLAKGSGVAAVERICRIVQIPHVFATGEGMCLGTGTAIVIEKPYTQAELVEAIDRTMSLKIDAWRAASGGDRSTRR